MKKCVKKVKSIKEKKAEIKIETPKNINTSRKKNSKKSAEEKVKIFQAAEKCSNLKLIYIHEQFNL